MFRVLCVPLLLMGCAGCGHAQSPPILYVPDGTVVFGELHTPFGRVVERLVGHPYTHVGIVVDGQLYEAELPCVQAKPYQNQGKRGGIYDYFAPKRPLNVVETNRLRSYLNGQLGRPYGLKTWLFPKLSGQRGIYCSELVQRALNASGRYQLDRAAGYDPPALYRAIHRDYRYFQTQRK